jgi:hypothetical protein
MADGGSAINLWGAPAPAGLVDSAAGSLAGTSWVIFWLALPVFVPACLYIFQAYRRTPHREVETGPGTSERIRRLADGFAVGMALTATLMAAPGLSLGLSVHDSSPPLPEWSDGVRVVLFSGALGMATVLVAVGIILYLRGGLGALPGRVLLWIGAVVLTVAGVLDSFSGTSLSGTTGTYTGDFEGGLLNHWMGLGTFVLPAAALALLLALSVTHVQLPWHLHLPRYHRHTLTSSAT